MDELETPFAPQEGEIPLSEHPNPYFERPSCLSLNGEWDFSLSKDPRFPSTYSEQIRVPFAVETKASLIGKKVCPDDYMHYEREITFPEEMVGEAGRIVFTNVDQVADVFLDGVHLAHHEGGYLPFEVYVERVRSKMQLSVLVHDDTESDIYPRGKQSLRPRGIWYTATSGIYGPVYFESLPKAGHIKGLQLIRDYDNRKLIIKADIAGDFSPITFECYYLDHLVGKAEIGPDLTTEIAHRSAFFPWSSEHPSLYRYVAKMGEDEVRGVYSFVKIETRKAGPHTRIYLNDEPLFLNGILDQGYCPESGLTYPSYEAMEKDIDFIKEAGFNYIRKHIKVEPLRFYYLCEKKGIYVGQDFVNGGSPYSPFFIMACPFVKLEVDDETHLHLGRKSARSREFFERQMDDLVKHFSPVSSVVLWTLFNEGWGQFDSRRLCKRLRELDPSRLIDATSGWFDTGSGDFDSHHVYFRKARLHNDGRRVLALSEFGGYSFKVKGHASNRPSFGYKTYRKLEKLTEGFKKLYLEQILPLVRDEGLSLLVYTQLSDVEGEINGLLTYDRKVSKINPAAIKETVDVLQKAFLDAIGKERLP